jgi:3-deoxy-manno-octulosonate cytidylyltransferase (CMP-KDO synthetase)
MIVRVAEIAAYLCRSNADCDYCVATDDLRISDFCASAGLNVVMTSAACRNGTERCAEVVLGLARRPSLIINLQGDNPLCPPWILQDLINEWKRDPSAGVYTPCVSLSWDAYEAMVEAKKSTPFSGTTVIVDRDNHALAFSKGIIPVVRNVEEARRINQNKSPIRRHVGLYAYTYGTLAAYSTLEESPYESGSLEGLEQFRFLHNGISIKVVDVDYRGRASSSGIDSPADVDRAERIISEYGELICD